MQKAYKLFCIKDNGKFLSPLLFNSERNFPLKIGEWIEATDLMINIDGHILSSEYFPSICGWHLRDFPDVSYIDRMKRYRSVVSNEDKVVWCECNYADGINYQDKANQNGIRNGFLIPQFAYLSKVPKDGFYKYKGNQSYAGEWIIAGALKVNRVLNGLDLENLNMLAY